MFPARSDERLAVFCAAPVCYGSDSEEGGGQNLWDLPDFRFRPRLLGWRNMALGLLCNVAYAELLVPRLRRRIVVDFRGFGHVA